MIEMATIPAPRREDFTFAQLVEGREDEFPILARAVRETMPAHDVRIEWLVETLTAGTWPPTEGIVSRFHRARWFNYQQIFRYPYHGPTPQGSEMTGGHDSVANARTAFLARVEQTLIYGVPHRDLYAPITACGGYKHFLGREINDADVLKLRPLREPFLWTHEWDYEIGVPLDTPKYEWLAEVSLQVVPGAA